MNEKDFFDQQAQGVGAIQEVSKTVWGYSMTHNRSKQTVALSATLYRWFLAAYPTRSRREHGPHMTQVFDDLYPEAFQQQGISGLILLWVSTLGDRFQPGGRADRFGIVVHPR